MVEVEAKIEGNGWNEWQHHVLAEIRRLSSNVDKLNESVQCHREKTAGEISALKVKAGIWGGIGGMIPAAIALFWYLINRHIMKA